MISISLLIFRHILDVHFQRPIYLYDSIVLTLGDVVKTTIQKKFNKYDKILTYP